MISKGTSRDKKGPIHNPFQFWTLLDQYIEDYSYTNTHLPNSQAFHWIHAKNFATMAWISVQDQYT